MNTLFKRRKTKLYTWITQETGNTAKDIAIHAEEELDEDGNGHTILKSEVVKAIKYIRRKESTGDDNTPVNLLK